jgi:alanyl-tRNA synthetase
MSLSLAGLLLSCATLGAQGLPKLPQLEMEEFRLALLDSQNQPEGSLEGRLARSKRDGTIEIDGAVLTLARGEGKLVAAALRAPVDDVEAKIAQMLDNVKGLERELAKMKSRLASGQGTDLAGQAVQVKGARVVAATLDGADAKTLREAVDRLKDQLKSAAIVLGAVADGKVALIAGVTADLTGKVKAGELVNFVAQQVGGKGGGRPDMAQAGGTEAANLPAALESVRAWVEQRI